MPSSSCAWPFREVCCRLVKDIDALQLVHFVREAQGFQNTRTSFFERVTAVTEYYGVLERVVQPKEKVVRGGLQRRSIVFPWCQILCKRHVLEERHGLPKSVSWIRNLVPLPASRDHRIWAKFARGSFAG